MKRRVYLWEKESHTNNLHSYLLFLSKRKALVADVLL